MTWRRSILLSVGLFLLAYAWAYSLGTSRQPEPSRPWTSQTIAEPVEVSVP